MSALKILVVDDEADIRALIKEILSDEGYDVIVASSASEARLFRKQDTPDLILLDIWMPDIDGITLLREWAEDDSFVCPVVIMSGHGTVDTAVEATRLGAFDFIEKPLSIAKLLRTVEKVIKASQKQRSTQSLIKTTLISVGHSLLMGELRDKLENFAKLDSSVLLEGEVGTGRGAFAKYMHDVSHRSENPYIRIPSASLTENNFEEQICGREDSHGIFSGYLERAENGTVVIDELTNLSPPAQKLILSVTEQKSFLRQNGNTPIQLNARIIATIDRNYNAIITEENVRSDLVSNLGILSVKVPSLREHNEDIPELLSFYVDKFVDEEELKYRKFDVAAQNRLRNYPWPGNLRELKNLVQKFLASGKETEITLEEIENEIESSIYKNDAFVDKDMLSLPLREAREQFERSYLQQQLILCDGKVGKLASRVGMERTHLYRKLKSLNIEFGFRPGKNDK